MHEKTARVFAALRRWAGLQTCSKNLVITTVSVLIITYFGRKLNPLWGEREIIMDNNRAVPRMRTVKEAATELNLPVYAVRQWVKAGAIPAVYCGKKALLNLDRVIEFLEGGAVDE